MENMSWATSEHLKYEIEHHPKYTQYMSWKNKYPHVLKQFKNLSLKLMERKRMFGMWLVANRIRWDYAFDYDTDFKITNDYTALITRELMIEIPELKKYCRIKKIYEPRKEVRGQYDFYKTQRQD